MSQECLIAEFSDAASFQTALQVLEKACYSESGINIVTNADKVSGCIVDELEDRRENSPPAGKTTGATTVAGGTLGAMLGTATLMGPLMVAGPILGMAVGAVGGGALSAIESWGVRQDVGQQYEEYVRQGSRLIILTGDEFELTEGAQMLKTCGPKSLERFQSSD